MSLLAVLLIGSSALAGEGDLRHGDARIESQAVIPQGTSVLYLLNRITGSVFLTPLVDDGRQSLEVLSYLQHPGTVSLAVSGSFGVSYSSLSTTVYPWQNTGLTATLASASLFNPPTSTNTAQSAGIIHYINPALRVNLSYVGTRTRMSFSNASVSLKATTSDTDAGQLGVALLLHEHALLSLAVQVGSVRNSAQTVPIPLETAYSIDTRQLTTNATASATGYFGRGFSVALGLGVGTLSGTDFDNETRMAVQRNDFLFAGSVGVQQFLTDTIYLRGNYKGTFTATSSGGVSKPSQYEHEIIIRAGSYF